PVEDDVMDPNLGLVHRPAEPGSGFRDAIKAADAFMRAGNQAMMGTVKAAGTAAQVDADSWRVKPAAEALRSFGRGVSEFAERNTAPTAPDAGYVANSWL